MITLFFLTAFVVGAVPIQDDPFAFNTPAAIRKCLKPVESQYKLSDRSNPFYLRGDFDGDGKSDYAVLVTNDKGERGMAVCRAVASRPEILGAGTIFNKLRDLTFGAWMVFPKGPVERGVEAGPPPTLRGDALLIIWPESASALTYWDGRGFRWYQQGD